MMRLLLCHPIMPLATFPLLEQGSCVRTELATVLGQLAGRGAPACRKGQRTAAAQCRQDTPMLSVPCPALWSLQKFSTLMAVLYSIQPRRLSSKRAGASAFCNGTAMHRAGHAGPMPACPRVSLLGGCLSTANILFGLCWVRLAPRHGQEHLQTSSRRPSDVFGRIRWL